jgi:CBS domain containing-hemolysin-like protein
VIELLERFKTSKIQMAVVLDEYGGTAGLITLEDLLEEIVGDISDEYDFEQEEPIQVIEHGRIVEISGKARVDEVNAVLGIVIPADGEYDTVAGYLFTLLGKIPKVGEVHVADGVEFRVLRGDDRRIDRLRLTLPAVQPADTRA